MGVEGTGWVRQGLDPTVLEYLGHFDVLWDVRLPCDQSLRNQEEEN